MAESLPSEVADKLEELLDLCKTSANEDSTWELVDEFLVKYANINGLANERGGRNYSLLHFAASWGKQDVCRSLVKKYGADPTMKTGRGETPGDLAARRGHDDVAQELKELESKPVAKDAAKNACDSSATDAAPPDAAPLDAAPPVAEEKNELPRAIEELIALMDRLKSLEGEDDAAWEDAYRLVETHRKDFQNLVNERAGRNYALIHCAASVGNAAACKRLLKSCGADPILRTSRGELPSELAERRGFADLAAELREQEEGVEDELKELLARVKDDGDTDMAWDKVYKFLDANKRVVNNTAGLNYGLLHHAASWGNTQACRTLIEVHGADPLMRTHKRKELPEDIAKKCDHVYTSGLLRAFAQGPARNYVSGAKRART